MAIDWGKINTALHAMDTAKTDGVVAAGARNLIRELKRSGVWVWLFNDDQPPVLDPCGIEHFSVIALETLGRGKRFNDKEKEFLSQMQFTRSPSDKQLDWLSSLAKRVDVHWEPPP